MSAERQFDTDQRSYYLNEINRAFPVSSRAADMSTIQTALGLVDPSMPSGTRDVTDSVRMMSDFGSSSGARSRDATCRGYTAPSSGIRAPDARTGCGWWYVPDPTLHSTAAYGSRRGPMDIGLDKTMGTGQWVWDLANANQLEGNKQASKLASCPDLAFNTYPNVGWCPSTSRGVLTDGAGNPAYPQDPGGDCPGGGIIMTAAQCPAPPPPSAGSGGTPTGGGGITGLCNSSPLSPGCVQSLVTQNSCSPNGLLAQSLGSGYPGQSSQFNAVYRYVQPSFQLSPAIMGGSGGPSDVTSASNAFRQFAQTATGRTASAASNLCYGTPFDPCALQSTDNGPYDPSCVVKEALRQGYSPNGGMVTGLNNNAPGSMDFWNSMPQWQNVQGDLAIIKQQADNPGPPAQQASALQTVYGVSVKYPKTGCNNYGVFMYRYFFPNWDESYFPTQGPQTHFLGRYIFKNGFPYKGSTMEDQTPAGGYLTEGQRYTTIFYPQQGGTYQFMLVSDDGLRMQINGQVVMDWHYCCGPPGYSTPINLIADQPYTITIDFWNGGGPWAFQITASVNGGPFGDMPADLKELQLPVDRRLPMIEYAFNKMPSASSSGNAIPISDTMNIFQNMFRQNAGIGPLNGRQCMLVNQGSPGPDQYGGRPSGLFNYLNLTQGVRLCAIKSFTMMVQVNNSVIGIASPSLFSIFNLPESVTTGPPRGPPLQPSYIQPYANRTNDFMITAENGIYPWGLGINPGQSVGLDTFFRQNFNNQGGSPYTLGQWFHFAFVWDDDFNGYTVYNNGTQTLRGFVPAYDPQLIMEQIRIGCDNHPDGQWWSGGIAWFRAFDYRLSTDLITRDMNDDWTNLI
jgi:hypothetical protein